MRALTLTCLLLFAAAAAAQLRTIPADAKYGVIRHLKEMTVEIDGKPQPLSNGAQIRDTDNRIVLPGSLSKNADARYLLDAAGLVHRVWLLSPAEKAALPPAPYPK